jgi:exopolysaccharide biosynthesis polyprenyl glycosylphosphotransferase
MSKFAITFDRCDHQTTSGISTWARSYLRRVVTVDLCCAAVSASAAVKLRFANHVTPTYFALSLALPLLWIGAVRIAGGYDVRYIGTGSDEFRRVLNAGVGLTAAVALYSYTAHLQLSRGFVLGALPSITLSDLIIRYAMRKRLHGLRASGHCMSTVVAVGHQLAVADLISELSREKYHGLMVIGACIAQPVEQSVLAGVPVYGGLDDVTSAVRYFGADTVAVLTCPEMDGIRLRNLAWELEKTGTDLCVAPSLLDVAGPRTTIRPTAGLPLLHVDHPQLGGISLIFKEFFDRCVAVVTLVLLAPLLAFLSMAICLSDGGPALFTQVRVGKNGRKFKIYKFRTMHVDAEQRKAQLIVNNELDGVLFKLRQDPRITALGVHLRRWSVDELPQLINVVLGHMSLVGPRPALPEEAARYADHVRRRLVVKPGMTGLWQVKGRSDLSWDESVRLDLRYVENWSLVLDLQIMWKTISVVIRGVGAYLGIGGGARAGRLDNRCCGLICNYHPLRHSFRFCHRVAHARGGV